VEDLEKSANPFAILVLAHLKGQETRDVPWDRLAWKFRLVRGLFLRGWSADRVRSLFRFIDWMMELPAELERQLAEQIAKFEEDNHMPYVTSIERLGIKKGLMRGIETILEARFGSAAESILSEIRQLSDVEMLEQILHKASTVERLEDLAGLWDPPGSRHTADQEEGSSQKEEL